MSDATPPANNPYESAPTPGQPVDPYGAQPYGAQPGLSPYGNVASVSYAHWGKRVGAFLIDWLLSGLAQLPLWIGYAILIADVAGNTTTDPVSGEVTTTGGLSATALILMVIGAVTGLLFFLWNTCLKGGRTGYTIGKGVLGIKLINEATGQPIGAGMAFVRAIAHVLDSLPCNLGYLWPLWDAKRQTFADKILSTVVIDSPKP